MPKPRSATGRPEHSRQLPADSLLQASEAALASKNFDDLRSNALKLAPTPSAPSELHRMWISCPTVVKKKHLCDMLDELAKDDQPQAWKDARQDRLLQDFKLIPNAGIRFNCASYATATKLSLVKLNAFGTQIQIARFSRYGSRYYVDLVRLPDEVTDRMIFDWFERHEAPPTCILPTFVRNGLPSRERTVYFGQDSAPQILVPTEAAPLREIEFPSPEDGMVKLRAYFVNHKVARYNRVTPPSILKRQAEDAARTQADVAAAPANPGRQSPAGSTPQEPPTGFLLSLKQSIRLAKRDASPSDSGSDLSDDAMSVGDSPPAIDDDASEAGSDTLSESFLAFLDEKVSVPTLKPEAALWAKAATNRRALLAKAGSESVEVHSISYDLDAAEGTAQAANLVRSNYYNPLWYDDLDTDSPRWHFDLEVRHSEEDEACLESTPVQTNPTAYLELIKPATVSYTVEQMSRIELYAYIDIFLKEFDTHSPLVQLATIEANPGIMLPAIESKERLDELARNRALCRLMAHTPPAKSSEHKACMDLLRTTDDHPAMLSQVLRHAKLSSQGAEDALNALSAWDVVLHIMAPTVYHDPLKLQVLIDGNPQFLTNLTIPLLSDHTLWLIGFSSFATGLLEYERVPAFLKLWLILSKL